MRTLLLSAVFFSTLFIPFNAAYGEDQKFPETEAPRIVALMPGELFIPGIEPALPGMFVARRPPDPFDPRVYWGEPESLKFYFKKKRTETDHPVIAVRISQNTHQKELEEEQVRKTIETDFPKKGYTNLKVEFLQWGQYPVVAMENMVKDDIVLLAWVGMNMPSGETMLLSYIYPNGKGHPTELERRIWNRFLHETKELPEQLYFLSQGQDMHAGYTVVTKGAAKMLVIAEKRKGDGKSLLAIEPLNKDTKFLLRDVAEGQLMSEWNHGAPMVKVQGIITVKNSVYDHTTGVLVREVDEFSVNPAELKLKPNVVVYDGE